MKYPIALLCFFFAGSLLGCQKYVRRDIEIRDATTHQPVSANIEVGYDLKEELSRAFTLFAPKLKRYKTESDADGRAEISVAPDVSWFVLLRQDAEPQGISFHNGGSPSHSLGIVYEQDGWMSTRMVGKAGEKGTLELKISSAQSSSN